MEREIVGERGRGRGRTIEVFVAVEPNAESSEHFEAESVDIVAVDLRLSLEANASAEHAHSLTVRFARGGAVEQLFDDVVGVVALDDVACRVHFQLEDPVVVRRQVRHVDPLAVQRGRVHVRESRLDALVLTGVPSLVSMGSRW